VQFDWDNAKNRTNRKKHGIDFEAAQAVFDDPFSVSFKDAVVDGEQRWRTMGAIGADIVVVAHTYHEMLFDETIRVISARFATSHERKMYAETRNDQT